MIELELNDATAGGEVSAETVAQMRTAALATLAKLGIDRGHLAIDLVGERRIHDLNSEHRAKDAPTDVLSFPVDIESTAQVAAVAQATDPLELGDIVICPQHTTDLVEATVHGVLHLCGYDHEVDAGEMLALQDEIMDSVQAQ